MCQQQRGAICNFLDCSFMQAMPRHRYAYCMQAQLQPTHGTVHIQQMHPSLCTVRDSGDYLHDIVATPAGEVSACCMHVHQDLNKAVLLT